MIKYGKVDALTEWSIENFDAEVEFMLKKRYDNVLASGHKKWMPLHDVMTLNLHHCQGRERQDVQDG